MIRRNPDTFLDEGLGMVLILKMIHNETFSNSPERHYFLNVVYNNGQRYLNRLQLLHILKSSGNFSKFQWRNKITYYSGIVARLIVSLLPVQHGGDGIKIH